MKKISTTLLAFLLILATLLPLASCGKSVDFGPLWENATYKEDTTLGEGAKTVTVKVIAGENSVTFTIKTDKENLAEALLEVGLLEGEEGPYGLYIKKVNGILADYDTDASYWSLSQDGTALMTGASGVTDFANNTYEFTYTK